MFGRKARQIANQAVMIATARKESHKLLSSIVERNKKIIELGEALGTHVREDIERSKIIKDQAELLREVHAQNAQLAGQLTDTRKDRAKAEEEARRAESAANAAIQAGGIIGDQLHGVQDELLQRGATIAALTAKVDDFEKTMVRMAEALKQARDAIAQRDITISALNAGKQELAQALQQAHTQLINKERDWVAESYDALPKKDTPALQALREEIAKARYEEGVMPIPDEWRVDQSIPLPKRTPGRKLQEQNEQDAAEVAKETTP